MTLDPTLEFCSEGDYVLGFFARMYNTARSPSVYFGESCVTAGNGALTLHCLLECAGAPSPVTGCVSVTPRSAQNQNILINKMEVEVDKLMVTHFLTFSRGAQNL